MRLRTLQLGDLEGNVIDTNQELGKGRWELIFEIPSLFPQDFLPESGVLDKRISLVGKEIIIERVFYDDEKTECHVIVETYPGVDQNSIPLIIVIGGLAVLGVIALMNLKEVKPVINAIGAGFPLLLVIGVIVVLIAFRRELRKAG